jgi:hypothetical protein
MVFLGGSSRSLQLGCAGLISWPNVSRFAPQLHHYAGYAGRLASAGYQTLHANDVKSSSLRGSTLILLGCASMIFLDGGYLNLLPGCAELQL